MTAPGAFIIFGATGDLARRMLFPSLYFLDMDGLLPAGLQIIGAARSQTNEKDFRADVRRAVSSRAGGAFSEGVWREFESRLSYCYGDATETGTYDRLKQKLKGSGDNIYYLSTSPALYTPIVRGLAEQGLSAAPHRIIVEKPIGKSRASGEAINAAIAEHFSENRTFRIDHYLGKETVQNLVALRFANALFEPLWNRHAIDHVQISVSETVGVEDRFAYYNEYGATRDMVQNHLLQLVCLTAMEPPANLRPDSVRGEKVKVLRALRPLKDTDLAQKTVRGQYTKGVTDGASVPGYVEEGGGRSSDTETFVAICAHIDNWRWAGVPFYLRTGKRMPERSSQIVIQFKAVPHSIFGDSTLLANRLTIRLQPEEAISLTLMNKTPTLSQGGYELKPLELNLSLIDAFAGQARRRIAYERLLLEAISDNSTLFVRRDEAEAAWLWVDRIIEGWSRIGMKPAAYPAGSWGPAGAFALTERNGHSWYE
ncbi:MAG: glucose-6-phosphate dehydrogenase [Alphaproteobacteria bacterium]|nr:glucose-6-phosphate dehydrogenase [Alphaproteobacteria bacterium]